MPASGETQQNERRRLVIRNERGLHARAAAKFVAIAGAYDAEIDVTREGTSVSGRSIMGLMMLAAGLGTEIEITASGPEAAAAIAAIATLVEARFDE